MSCFGAVMGLMKPSCVSIAMSSMRHPPTPGEIDARLDGDHVTGDEHGLIATREARLLVDEQPNAVTKAVTEGARIGLIEEIARDAVDVAADRAGTNGVQRHQLRVEHALVHRSQLLAHVPEGDRARHVGAIAVDRRAEVQCQQFAFGDDVIRRRRVRQRAVDARGGDRVKGGLFAAQFEHCEVQQDLRLFLRHARLQLPQQAVKRLTGDRGGAADAVDLVRVLDHAQTAAEAA